jgi:hypothetical protein
MNTSFSKLLLAPLAALALASFALAPVAEGARGGGGGGGGGARASGGGGGRQTAQVNNSRADTRTNDVRSTSANSVNSNRNTNVNASRNTNINVNVDQHGGGWDNDYHPVAGAVAIGAAVAVTSAVIGSMVTTVPVGCAPVNYGGMVYQQCGGTWYQPQGSQFIVVNPPY